MWLFILSFYFHYYLQSINSSKLVMLLHHRLGRQRLRGELKVKSSVESVEVEVSLEVVERCGSLVLCLPEGRRSLLRSSEGWAGLLLRLLSSKRRLQRLLLSLSSLLEGEGRVNSLGLLLLRYKC